LASCASPDWVDPNTWFDDSPPAHQAIAVPQTTGPIPNLATVPDLVPLPSPEVQRRQIAEGLTADRANARYSDEPLTVESTAVPAAEPPMPDAPAPDSFSVAAVDEDAGGELLPDAPPPPIGILDDGGAAEPDSATAMPSDPPPPVSAGAPAPPSPAPGAPAALSVPEQPTLLQQQAFASYARQQQRMQELAMRRQAFEQQARQQNLEQMMLRQQTIDQQLLQRRSLELQARQMAAAAPIPQASALQAYPQGPAPQPYPQGAASAQVYGGGIGGAASGSLVGIVYFGHGSTGLDGNDQQVLREVASMMSQSAGLEVVGHASARTGVVDAMRHKLANLDISMRRANAVADALASMGAPRDRISVVARSDSQPVYHEFMPTGEAGNRRVEIYLTF